ncbi:MAG: 16S rRNA (cytosine(967)-C(5))-methyltransferase RsmB [Betaproteobacteria bacterium]|nr:16S rRNA (cytosine(967)-C(5))-methyltransferase RsmB [Betaproteobacteria bacterium]
MPQTATQAHSLAQSFAAAGEAIGRVIAGESLTQALAAVKLRHGPGALAAAAQDFSYNALRAFGMVDALLDRLLDKPLADAPLRGLLFAALCELRARPGAAHAIVHQAVEAAAELGRPRAKGLVNGVLRSFQRRGPALLEEIEATDTGRHRHPQWWIDTLRAAYPGRWEAVLEAGNVHPPMTLRVNPRRTTPEQYEHKLRDAGIGARLLGGQAVRLDTPCRVEALPGFAAGEVSVQDAGAQRAAPLLDVRDGMRVLDACAAPGGKTAHIAELAECDLVAVDNDADRSARIAQNLARLGLAARVAVGDARMPASFSEGKPFDRILLDVPCSASGVVRRHPDIKWLRRPGDVAAFASLQAAILDASWGVLAPSGKLLYVTCSVFPAENGTQVNAFAAAHPDARVLSLAGVDGGQLLPGPDSDGFFYALMQKARA